MKKNLKKLARKYKNIYIKINQLFNEMIYPRESRKMGENG